MQNFQDFQDLFVGDEIATECGEFYICRRRPDEFLPQWDLLEQSFLGLFRISNETLKLNSEFEVAFQARPDEILFLDIETTSLSSNAPLFLVGLLHSKAGEFRIDQFFARDYSEELPLLLYLNRFLWDFRVLVTFNGKAFDISYIEGRAAYHRCFFQLRCFHLDLLLHARRRWKYILPNCKLQTLETYICNRRRLGDIPSSLIPEAYHEFVRGGDFAILKEIFHHNALDLITMLELTTKMVDG